ncbi:hypothetical protein [Nakamurella deserti]|uniref:hypothetical protein n=1 Tax=Nakamurella deserti TaxID=2164074 RepID=UPI001300A2CD|nr:hypothetical protein [Nakamurella deserti]
MPRTDQITVRAIGFTMLAVTAVVLSGCVTTVDGRAAASATIAPLATTTTFPTTTTPTTTTPTTTDTGTTDDAAVGAPTTGAPTTDAPSGPVDDAPVGLSIGEAITSTYEDGEADIWVRRATFEGTGAETVLRVTVDYECYEGEFSYDVRDWTVLDSTGRRSRPLLESGFGAADEQDSEVAEFGVIPEWEQKRGQLIFDVAPGDATLEFGYAWGDPATWIAPAS